MALQEILKDDPTYDVATEDNVISFGDALKIFKLIHKRKPRGRGKKNKPKDGAATSNLRN